MTRSGSAAAVAIVAVLSLAGCTTPDDDTASHPRASAATNTAGPAPATAAAHREPCPDLPRTAAREDGLPALELPCLGDGPDVRLSDLRGVPTVLNVWAAWCTNCDREMPLFADAVERAGGDVRFLGVHYKATREQGLRSEDDFGVPFPSVHDEDGDLVVEALRAYAPPQTLFVTAEGRLVAREIGEITSRRQLAQLVKRHLGVDL